MPSEQEQSVGFLAELRRVNSERYEAWITAPIMLCEHCGSSSPETVNCAPPFQVQPHSFTKPHPYLTTKNDAGILFDAAELGGEVGELLNVVKKLEREERGWPGSRASAVDFEDECADVLICLDKLARRKGVDLAAATVRKFNATSDKVGLPQKLTPNQMDGAGQVEAAAEALNTDNDVWMAAFDSASATDPNERAEHIATLEHLFEQHGWSVDGREV